MNIEWNAEEYKNSFSFVHKYGKEVTELITLPEGSFVCDLGCGGGQLTYALKCRGYNVIGIDDSQDMLNEARKSYPDMEFRLGNALDFELERQADGIFSNAVFHWINREDQETLIKNIGKNLKMGGELVCGFGGKGCAETVHSALEDIFERKGLKYTREFYFPSVGEYSSLLEKNGFKVTSAVLFDRPTIQERGISGWIKMFDKKPFEGLSQEFAEEITEEAERTVSPLLTKNGVTYVDYVRIRIKALKMF